MKKTMLLMLFLFAITAASFAQTGDPWIKKVYNDTWGRNPTAFEYNINNYNGGHWNSYSELMQYIYEFQKNLASSNISFKYSAAQKNNRVVVGVFQNGVQIAADLISNDGGSIIAQGGASIISNDGGSIVAQGAGNVVAQGGGNITVVPGTKGASFGSAYTLQGNGVTVVKTSAKGALVIK